MKKGFFAVIITVVLQLVATIVALADTAQLIE